MPPPQRFPEEIAELIANQSGIILSLKSTGLHVLNGGSVVSNTVTFGAKILIKLSRPE